VAHSVKCFVLVAGRGYIAAALNLEVIVMIMVIICDCNFIIQMMYKDSY